jgi:hypothetical protein
MKSLGVTLLTWAALFAPLWYGLHELYYPPGDWAGALIVSFFMALGIGAIRKGRLERRDAALLMRSDEAPRDGQRIALAGTLDPIGEPLHAPFSGANCVMYDYSISHVRPTKRSGGTETIVDRTGMALAPAAIHAGVRTIRLLAVPGLERFSKTGNYDKLLAGARRYVAETTFEGTNILLAIPKIARLGSDGSGSIRQDLKLTSNDDLENAILEEQFVPPGEKVCLIGRYSAEENAIVPEADAGGVRVIRGTRQKVLSFISDSRRGDLIAGVLLIIVPALVIWGVLTWRERYFNLNGQPSVRSVRREEFFAAAARGDVETMARDLRRGVDVSARNEDGDTALAGAHDARTAEALLAAGGNVNAAGHDGLTPLMRAAVDGRTDVARVLIEHGASVNAPGKDGRTPLMFAATNGRVDVVRLLIEHGADVNAVNRADGRTALWLAVDWDHEDVARILREAGAREEKQ